MKVAFIFGKGVEGCGVTKHANVFEEWLVSQGHETMVVDFDNKQKFGRAGDIKWLGDVRRVEASQSVDDAQPIVDEVNKCDIAIVHSFPTRRNPEYIDRFRIFVERIANNPILVVHDHAITKNTINRQTQVGEFFALADIGVTQSYNGFSKECYVHHDPSFEDRIVENPIWLKPSYYDQYRLPFEERKKLFMHIGRMSTLKDPAMISRIEPYLKNDWELLFMGCERSISSIGDPNSTTLATDPSPYHRTYKPKILFISTAPDGTEYLTPREKEKDPANITMTAHDNYVYEFGMETLGSSIASWCGYRLSDPKEYGHRMEFTVVESFLLTLPVISKHFAENAYSPEGKKWGEYYGPLISEATCEKELAAELNRIYNDKDEWDARTAACREMVSKFNDIEVLGPKFLDFVLSKGKRKDKKDFIESISSYFPSARERRDKGEIIVSTPGSLLNEIPYTLVDGKQNEIKEVIKPTSTLSSFFK